MAGAKKEVVEESRATLNSGGNGDGMEEWPGAQAGFKSGFSGDCAANAMHGSIAPTRVLISLEFDSHLSGVNQDKISTKKFKTAHNGFPPFSVWKGREGSLFFSSLILPAFSSDSRDLNTHQTRPACWDLACGE